MSDKPRSVVDYETEDDLRKALMSNNTSSDDSNGSAPPAANTDATADAAAKAAVDPDLPPQPQAGEQPLDWILTNFDTENTEVQSMKEELHRLQVLKSYLILDDEREQAFERITGLASRFFDVPIALVSLVDLGRQWFMSNRGLGDIREAPRKLAFCAHTILNKQNIMTVPDATMDVRFKDNPLVTGPPHVRFYAGANLVCPEGYKLGTLCIVDTRPRPAGLSEDEKDALRDLADMVIKLMVDRRFRLQTEEQEQAEEPVEEPTPASPAQLIAYTAHDLMTPLTGVQLSLSLLKDDEEVQRQLGSHHLELVKTAANCSDLMLRICQTVIDTLRQETAAGAPAGVTGTTATATASVGVAQSDNINMPVTKMIDLVNSLCMIMKPIPKHVPLIVTLDPAVPPIIMSDDLKLFRSALNLLSHAMSRTELGYVHLKISTKEDNGHLLFECENTGKDVEEEEYQYLFQPGRTEDGSLHLGLSSAASLINSLDGQYGFRAIAKAEGQRRTGSIFWFSVPLFLPGDVGRNEKVAQQQRKPKLPVIPLVRSVASVASNNCSLSSLVPGDILQAESLQSCCVNATVDPEANAPILTNGKKPGTRQRRALVIDDSLVVRKSLALALNQLGFDVTQAKDGLEGFARLKETVFDVTLCDFLMPVMDGMDCVEQYREWESKNRAGFRQLIVGMSAHASANDHGQGLKAGMDDFKPKPISMKDLTEIQDSDVARKQNEKLNALGGTKVSGTGSSATKVVDGEPAESATSKRAAEETPSTEAKRPRKTPIDVPMETGTPVCLIATDKSSVEPNDVLTTLESKGWKVVVVHDGEDALHLLQTRNWDAVLIDDDLPILAGTPCVTKFREWEQNNRDKRQLNVCLVCNGDIPSPGDKASTIQPPHGVDGVLGKPAQWKNLQCVMDKNEKDGTLGGVGRGPA